MRFRTFAMAARSAFARRSAEEAAIGFGAVTSRFKGLGGQIVHGWGKSAMIFGTAQAFMSEPGAMVSSMIGGTMEILGPGYVSGMLLTGNPIAAIGAAFVFDPYIGGQIRRGIQSFSRFEQINNWNRNQLSAGMLQAAYTMRQAAARDMAGSLMNARQWLGKEAAFYHG